MIRTTLNWTVKNLKAMYDEKETLSFEHPIQRQSGQWDKEQQSLLIHSMLANFPVPAVYIHKTESVETDTKGKHVYSYSVLDGKQRMTSVFGFINGLYPLSEGLPDVEIEDRTYEIAGKYFEDLEEDVQQEILRFRFSIQAFENVTDEEIEEIFFRLNNSTPLTKPQKSKPLMGVENSIFVNELLAGRFFREKCCFTRAQLKNSDDMCTLLQCMMLLDYKYRGYEFDSISADEVMKYSRHIKGNYPDECRDRLKKVISFLDSIFYMKDKNLKKINIPVIFWVTDEALRQSVSVFSFRRWFQNFFKEYKEEYGKYCSSGSVRKEKVIGRIGVMQGSFLDCFQPAEPAKSEGQEAAETSGQESAGLEPQEFFPDDVPLEDTRGSTGTDIENAAVPEDADNEVPKEPLAADLDNIAEVQCGGDGGQAISGRGIYEDNYI